METIEEIRCDCPQCRPLSVTCRTCGVTVEWDDAYIRERRAWVGCRDCATVGDAMTPLAPSIRHFARAMRVRGLVETARQQADAMAYVAHDARDYDQGASPAEWDALHARADAASKGLDAALTELATLAIEGDGR